MTEELTLDVRGMSCGHCLNAVRSALDAIEGVTVKSVRIGAAVVDIDREQVPVATLIDAVADAGYEADERT